MRLHDTTALGLPLSIGWRWLPLLCLLTTGCSALSPGTASVRSLPPLQLTERQVAIAEAQERVQSPDLLGVDDDMRTFVERYTGGMAHPRQRLMMLHRALRGSATLGVDYDPSAGGTAADVFHRGTANCLSYASLFIALAREAGLDAGYQWLEVRPQWTRQGERVMVSLHVNAVVNTQRREQYMVDIDPLPSRDIAGSREISDADAVALYHSNVAMRALARGDSEQAFLHSVRALMLSPQMAHLWVNLGATYRYAGQHDVAEMIYLHALQLDPLERSAMNNLVVLYAMDGREDDRRYWDQQVTRYRDANPYYHAWLGDLAAQDEHWDKARDYYERAVSLSPEDARLLYALGITHQQLGDVQSASQYLRQAIDRATLRSDIDAYSAALRTLQTGAPGEG
ncbi:MAG: tetratricopeptide repeat protein [Pseudomonadota bacterium]